MRDHRTRDHRTARSAIAYRSPVLRASVTGIAALACVLGAGIQPPHAAATVTRIGVLPDINYGPLTNYGTGCSYTIEAVLTDAVTPVSLYDNGIPLATIAPTGGVALATWIPTSRGPHTLTAVQAPQSGPVPGVSVYVGVGMPIGTSCLVV
ncbi:hypothetical protein [Nocardia aurea]|uniref:hypothetical protein n=1 Tax=Nocardia aurea TaxID=2144174 RepID=UPI0033BA8831